MSDVRGHSSGFIIPRASGTNPPLSLGPLAYAVALITLYLGVLISLWLLLFAAQPKEFSLDGLKKLEQRSHKCLELRGEYVQ
jgi:hypothetical protein